MNTLARWCFLLSGLLLALETTWGWLARLMLDPTNPTDALLASSMGFGFLSYVAGLYSLRLGACTAWLYFVYQFFVNYWLWKDWVAPLVTPHGWLLLAGASLLHVGTFVEIKSGVGRTSRNLRDVFRGHSQMVLWFAGAVGLAALGALMLVTGLF